MRLLKSLVWDKIWLLLYSNNMEEEDKLQRHKEMTRIGTALEEETVDSGFSATQAGLVDLNPDRAKSKT